MKPVLKKLTVIARLNPRIVLEAIIIKQLCNIDDREVVDQIVENRYMLYFFGYFSFINEPLFDPFCLWNFASDWIWKLSI